MDDCILPRASDKKDKIEAAYAGAENCKARYKMKGKIRELVVWNRGEEKYIVL